MNASNYKRIKIGDKVRILVDKPMCARLLKDQIVKVIGLEPGCIIAEGCWYVKHKDISLV